MAKPTSNKPAEKANVVEEMPVCGIIIPISAMPPEYDASHWVDVRRVLDDAIGRAGMQPQIVSDSFETDVIQRRIVHNLYDNPVVVCDVSGLNPNVMFELGMRLTFKKPVVIVTDDVKRIPFDTSIIEHLLYPRDLHIHKTNEFVDRLAEKVSSLNDQVKSGKFKPFLEAFGTFEVFQPTTESVPADTYIAERLDELAKAVRRIERQSRPQEYSSGSPGIFAQKADSVAQYRFGISKNIDTSELVKEISNLKGVISVVVRNDEDLKLVDVRLAPLASSQTESQIRSLLGKATDGMFAEARFGVR